MNSHIQTLSWWSQTRSVIFSPRAFFAKLEEPCSYRHSLVYLAKTALAASFINTLVITTTFYIVASSFASILSAFILIFGVLLTPLIAVAANISPEKVPSLIESFTRIGEVQIAITSARLGVLLLAGFFGTIVTSTCLQAAIAHSIARLLGSNSNFRATASVISYGSAAWMLSTIPFLSVCAPVYAAVLNILGMKSAHKLNTARATFIIAIASAMPVIGAILYLCKPS